MVQGRGWSGGVTIVFCDWILGVGDRKDRILETVLIVLGKLSFFSLSSNQIQFQENNLLLVTYTIRVRKWPQRALHFSCLILAARNRTEFWLTFANPVGLHVGSFCLLTALCFHVEIWPSWFLFIKCFVVKTFIF